MRGLLCNLLLFSNELNKYNTVEGMLDSIYHIALKLL